MLKPEPGLESLYDIVSDILNEAGPKELFRTKAKNGGEFVVYERDVKGAGQQDAVMMYVVKDGKTENHGSHVSVKGAKAYAKNHNII